MHSPGRCGRTNVVEVALTPQHADELDAARVDADVIHHDLCTVNRPGGAGGGCTCGIPALMRANAAVLLGADWPLRRGPMPARTA